jgi:hypothetical protein
MVFNGIVVELAIIMYYSRIILGVLPGDYNGPRGDVTRGGV